MKTSTSTMLKTTMLKMMAMIMTTKIMIRMRKRRMVMMNILLRIIS